LTGLGVAWVAPCFGSLLQPSHPMGFRAASNTMTPQLADKRMAVLSHLAVWWCSSRRAPLSRFRCANERCRRKTNVRNTGLGTRKQTIKPLDVLGSLRVSGSFLTLPNSEFLTAYKRIAGRC
jgi:hypothetical protein